VLAAHQILRNFKSLADCGMAATAESSGSCILWGCRAGPFRCPPARISAAPLACRVCVIQNDKEGKPCLGLMRLTSTRLEVVSAGFQSVPRSVEMIGPVFKWSEDRLNPYPKSAPEQPPQGLLAFCL